MDHDAACDAPCSKCKSDWTCPYIQIGCSVDYDKHVCPKCEAQPMTAREQAARFYFKAINGIVQDWIDGFTDGAEVDPDVRDLAKLLEERERDGFRAGVKAAYDRIRHRRCECPGMVGEVKPPR